MSDRAWKKMMQRQWSKTISKQEARQSIATAKRINSNKRLAIKRVKFIRRMTKPTNKRAAWSKRQTLTYMKDTPKRELEFYGTIRPPV